MDPLEGKTGIQKSTGQRVIRRDGKWVPLQAGGKPPVQEASMRGRMDLGLAPMVSSHEAMLREQAKGNPFSLTENPLNAAAQVMSEVGVSIPGMGIDWRPLEGAAKFVGGDDFQRYQQASKTFESQLMPLMSGAAVSPSEAERQRKAALPELGDSPANLSEKDKVRAMMLNGAAKARGLPLPYPNLPTYGVNTVRPPGGPAAPAQGQPGVRRYNPKTGRIE
jgi:hypothetical protein